MLEGLRKDWGLKALALAIAFMLWIAITGEDRALTDVQLPLQIDLPPGLVLASPPPTAVTVRLEGPRTVIRRLEPIGLDVRIDLRDAAPGERDVQLEQAQIRGLPRQVSVAFFLPARVELTVDRLMRQALPVEVELVGSPPAGYTLYNASARPDAVLVEGPESEVTALRGVTTDPVRLDHRTRPFTVTVGAVPDRPHVRLVDPVPLEVRVIVDESPVEATFPGVPVVIPEMQAGASASPAELTVVLRGPRPLLERISRSQIRAVADLGGQPLSAEPRSVTVEAGVVDLPEDQMWRIQVKSVTPPTVAVRREAGARRS
jgi:YbbR domain-containing protein